MTNIRTSQLIIEALLLGSPTIRASQLPAEILLDFLNKSNLRTSQLAIEVLLLGNPNLRVSQIAIEVIIGAAEPTPPPTVGRVLGPPVQVI